MGFLSSIFKGASKLAPLIPGIGPFAGAAIGMAGEGIGSALDAKEERKTYNRAFQGTQLANAQRIAAAQKQMDFQERMSNTAHQREIADLKAAGLNPILSSKYGGASSPGGSLAQIQEAVTPALSSAVAKRRQTMELDQASAAINAQYANTRLADQSAKTSKSQEELNAVNATVGSAQEALLSSKKRQTDLENQKLEVTRKGYGILDKVIDEFLSYLEMGTKSSAKGKVIRDSKNSPTGKPGIFRR